MILLFVCHSDDSSRSRAATTPLVKVANWIHQKASTFGETYFFRPVGNLVQNTYPSPIPATSDGNHLQHSKVCSSVGLPMSCLGLIITRFKSWLLFFSSWFNPDFFSPIFFQFSYLKNGGNVVRCHFVPESFFKIFFFLLKGPGRWLRKPPPLFF